VQTGVLSGLLRSEEDRKEAVQEGAEQGQPVTVDGSPAAGTTPDGSSELPHGQPAAGDARPGGAAGEGRAGEAGGTGEPKLTTSLSKRTGRDRVGDVAETGAAETTGEAVGTIIQKNVDTKARPTLPYSIQAGLVLSARARPARRGRAAARARFERSAAARAWRPAGRGRALSARARAQGWDLVLTGHSLGAGAAALIALKLRSRFPGAARPARAQPGAGARSSASRVPACMRAGLRGCWGLAGPRRCAPGAPPGRDQLGVTGRDGG